MSQSNAEVMNTQGNVAAADAEAAGERKDYATEAAFANAVASFHIAQALYQLLDVQLMVQGMRLVEKDGTVRPLVGDVPRCVKCQCPQVAHVDGMCMGGVPDMTPCGCTQTLFEVPEQDN